MGTGTTTELRDASGLVDDGAALRDRIAVDGYLFFRGLLDPRFVAGVGRAGLAALQAAGWTEGGVDPVLARPALPVRAVRMRDAFSDPGYRRIIADPGFNCLPFGSPLSRVMGQLLGPLGVCYPLKIPRVVYPPARSPGIRATTSTRTTARSRTCSPAGCRWATCRAPSAAWPCGPGASTARAFSHRPLDWLEPGWATTDYRAGDVLVLHCLTTHAALPNRTGRMRVSGEYRWQLADQPAPRRMVIGPNGAEIGSRLFGRTSWWRPVAPRLELFEGGGADADPVLPAPPSRFVAFEH